MQVFATISVLAGLATVASAQFNYGNLNGVTVDYIGILEDSTTDPGVALFGAPTISVDSLRFSPTSFGAFASNGSTDITDGTLTTIIQARPGNFIPALSFNESGDYSLFGTGTAATSARVGMTVFIDVLEVNGLPVTVPTWNSGGTFSPNGGVYDLATTGPAFLAAWVGGGTFDISTYLAGFGITGIATKVSVTIDNQLVATSEVGTSSFIKKKEIGGVAITVVPAPASLALLGLGGMVAGRRRR